MTIEETVRALAELSDIDLRLSGAGSREDRVPRSLEGRRAALREAIPGNMLAAYDDLGRAGRRPAVVPLVRGSYCGGCYMRVPPQLHAFVRRGQSVCSCPRCRRLLYVARDPEPAGGNGSKAHAAKKDPPGNRATPTRTRRRRI
jgi:predicted  nucleic acid-binding Zn-ribbon protein